MKRLLHIVLFSLFVIMLFGLMGFIYMENARNKLQNIKVRIIGEQGKGFLDQEDILSLIHSADSTSHTRIRGVDTELIEQQIRANPFVDKVDAFVNVDNDLIINVAEREPFLRIYTRYGHSFYLDKQGNPFPLNEKHSAMVTIASGYIELAFDRQKGVPELTEESKMLSDIYSLANTIHQNPFMDALISQIYLNSKGEFDLIPEIGDYIIRLGKLENAGEKLDKLEFWYKESFLTSEWDKYYIINLKYKDQVVCTKK